MGDLKQAIQPSTSTLESVRLLESAVQSPEKKLRVLFSVLRCELSDRLSTVDVRRSGTRPHDCSSNSVGSPSVSSMYRRSRTGSLVASPLCW